MRCQYCKGGWRSRIAPNLKHFTCWLPRSEHATDMQQPIAVTVRLEEIYPGVAAQLVDRGSRILQHCSKTPTLINPIKRDEIRRSHDA